MKIKTVEITKQAAHKKLDRVVVGATLTTLICVLIVAFSQAFPLSLPVINMMIACVGILGLMVGLAILVVVSFAKSEIKALNILFYGTKFKEVTDAKIKS